MYKATLSLFAALLVLVTSGLAHAQDFPELTGRVVDEADLLSPQEESAITAKLEALETNSNRQLVVTTIRDLQGYDIADYGYQLGRHWAIGQDGEGESEKDNGVLLIVAPNERKMRIEVGYGLEPILTDALSSQIIRNDITPKFKAGDFPGGINAGVDRITTQLTLPPDEAARIAQEAENRGSEDSGADIGLIIFWLFIFIFFIWPIISSAMRGGKKHRRKGYSGPVVIWGGGGWGGSSGGSSWGGGGGGFGGGGFSGGGGSFGGGGASGGW